MAEGTFVRADIDTEGHVSILRNVNGENWRVGVPRHDTAALDNFAPDMPAEARALILSLWGSLPEISQD